MALVTVPSVGVVPAPIKAGRILGRTDIALVVWFTVGDVHAMGVEKAVQPARFTEKCMGLGDGRTFVRPAVRL